MFQPLRFASGVESVRSPGGDPTPAPDDAPPDASTILTVEDEVILRVVVADYLRDCGYRVIEAGSAEEAQDILRSGERVDVLFSDINLGPGISGLHLARWTREHHPDVRIILTSGVAQLSQDAVGLCDVAPMAKPYAYPALKAHVERLLAMDSSAASR
ncbi:MAG: response regulator [Reyranellaceae bacterium]